MSALNDPEIWEASQERQRMAQRARGIEERMHDLNERRRLAEQGDRTLDRARRRADSSVRLDQPDGFSERYQALRRREVVHDAIERMGERDSWASRRTTDSYRPDNEHCDWPTPEESNTRASQSETSPTAPTPPPFIITTESDDNESEPETHPRERMRDVYLTERLRREGRASYRRHSPEADDDADPNADDLDFASLSHMMRDDRYMTGRPNWRATRRSSPSRIEPSLRDHNALGMEHGPDGGEDRVRPLARFFIHRDKSRISINFEPAV